MIEVLLNLIKSYEEVLELVWLPHQAFCEGVIIYDVSDNSPFVSQNADVPLHKRLLDWGKHLLSLVLSTHVLLYLLRVIILIRIQTCLLSEFSHRMPYKLFWHHKIVLLKLLPDGILFGLIVCLFLLRHITPPLLL